jgi:hypothetical protein
VPKRPSRWQPAGAGSPAKPSAEFSLSVIPRFVFGSVLTAKGHLFIFSPSSASNRDGDAGKAAGELVFPSC